MRLALLASCSLDPGEQKVNKGPEWLDCGLAREERGKSLSQRNLWKKGVVVITAAQPLPEDLRRWGKGEVVASCVCERIFPGSL